MLDANTGSTGKTDFRVVWYRVYWGFNNDWEKKNYRDMHIYGSYCVQIRFCGNS